MTPGFALVNNSASVNVSDLETIAAALELYWADLALAWALPPAPVEFDVFGGDQVPDEWVPILFTDVVSQSADTAFHDSLGGQPNIVIEVPQYAGAGVLMPNPGHGTCLSVGVAHEVAETACDPQIDLVHEYSDGRTIALEVCDPVQDLWYPVETAKGQVAMSDFVTPFWFDLDATRGAKLDQMGKCKSPGEILDGYAVIYDTTGTSMEIFGARAPNPAMRLASRRRRARLQRRAA
jgi:hypothetical protein